MQNSHIFSLIFLMLISSVSFAQTKTLKREYVEANGISFEKTHQRAGLFQYNKKENIAFYDFERAAFAQLYLLLDNPQGGDTLIIHVGECLKEGRVDRNPGEARRYKELKMVTEKGRDRYDIPIPPDKRNTRKPAILMPKKVGEVMPFRYCEVEIRGRNQCQSNAKSRIRMGKKSLVRVAINVPFNERASHFRAEGNVSFNERASHFLAKENQQKGKENTLDSVWDLCKHSIKATTYTGYYVDGDRERIAYEADALINQLCHYGVDAEYDVARRTFEHLMKNPTWPTEWIMQMVLVAWNDLLYTGNTDLIRRYEKELRAHTLLALVDKQTGLVTTRRGQTKEFLASIGRRDKISDIVDWPHSGILGLAEGQGGEDDGYVYTDFNAVVNAYHYEAVKRLAMMLDYIGKKAEARELKDYCARFKNIYNDAFFDKENGRYRDGIGTQHSSLHANMFAVCFDLLPSEAEKERVANYIISRGMACSVYGSYFLLNALYDLNRGEEALNLMTSQSKRSWINMLREGTTITMEAWGNEFKPNQDWNHAWGAAPASIVPMRLVGVRPLNIGCSEVEIAPQIGALKRVRSLVPTIHGAVKVEISQSKKKYSVKIEVPEGIEPTVRLLPEIEQNRKVSIRVRTRKYRFQGSETSFQGSENLVPR